MISKVLNSADSRFARICPTALRSVFCSSRPKTVAPISPARQEKVQPASWIFRPNPSPSRFLTNFQPGAQGSLSNRRTFGKSVPSLDQDGPRLEGVWHLGSSRRFQWRIVRHQLAPAIRCFLPLDSIFVTGHPSSRLPHVVFRRSDIDLFVCQRHPQFSNNFTGHVERGPGLAFGSHGFRQKSAFLNQPGSRIGCVCH